MKHDREKKKPMPPEEDIGNPQANNMSHFNIRESQAEDLDINSIRGYCSVRLSVLNDDENLELRPLKFSPYVKPELYGKSDLEPLVNRCIELNAGGQIYLTLNPSKPFMYDKSHRATSDADITRKVWLYIDIDAIRIQDPNNKIIPPPDYEKNLLENGKLEERENKYLKSYACTDEELKTVYNCFLDLAKYLKSDFGLSEEHVMHGLSGNGVCLLIRVEMPACQDSTDLHVAFVNHLKGIFEKKVSFHP